MKTTDSTEKRNVRYETTLSGKVLKINVDAEIARLDFLKKIQERLIRREITPQEATRLTNEFGRKNQMIIKS